MKSYLFVFMLLFLNVSSFSQTSPAAISFIEPYPLEVTVNKTTNLVFPYGVKSVDRGSLDVLVQKANYVDTILQLKAARENFKETNLTVITTDGNLYSFIVNYSSSPRRLNYLFATPYHTNGNVLSDNEADYLNNSKQIFHYGRFIRGVKSKQNKIQLRLDGIYVQNDKLYFQMQLTNASNLSFRLDMFRFLIRNKKHSKRTSLQEVQIKPVYTYGNISIIKGQTNQELVMVLPAFTISNSKYLLVEITNTNGIGKLDMKIRDRLILKAKTVVLAD